MMATAPDSPALSSTATRAGAGRPRVALVCDLVEENWPSMQLVADMLGRHLELDHSGQWEMARLCPSMRRHFSVLPGSRAFWNNADRLTNRFVDYPLWLRHERAAFDLFHIVDHSYSQLVHQLPAERTVVTCHDLDTFRCLLEPSAEPRPGWFRAMSRRILKGFEKAAHVITVSATTRDAILHYGLLPAERVTVVHNGVHPACTPAPDPSADEAASRLLPAKTADAFWLLHVGSTIPRKRIDVLLRVFAAVRAEIPGARLVRVGAPFTPAQLQLSRDLGIEASIQTLAGVKPEVLAAIYRRADVLLQPSESEGFGLPVVEALACGCPVIASDIPVLREVGGPAAIYAMAGDIAAWRDAVLALHKERAQPSWELRSQLGVLQAARFSWAETADQVARIYDMVLRKSNA
ncbi:MAG TPA: glycosyltransferase family 1 protein [Bryobacteraceae bacterium]|nr:glycosyltransferase family 1 protein [Bryobacteraceae bacterium]